MHFDCEKTVFFMRKLNILYAKTMFYRNTKISIREISFLYTTNGVYKKKLYGKTVFALYKKII